MTTTLEKKTGAFGGKNVTQLIKDIGTLRDGVLEGDCKKLASWLPLFSRVKDGIVRNYQRHLANAKNELDFNSWDMEELADDLKTCYRKIERKLGIPNMQKTLLKLGEIQYGNEYSYMFSTRAMCVELHSVACYIGSLLRCLEDGTAIRKFK